jgi:hypothetical protein
MCIGARGASGRRQGGREGAKREERRGARTGFEEIVKGAFDSAVARHLILPHHLCPCRRPQPRRLRLVVRVCVCVCVCELVFGDAFVCIYTENSCMHDQHGRCMHHQHASISYIMHAAHPRQCTFISSSKTRIPSTSALQPLSCYAARPRLFCYGARFDNAHSSSSQSTFITIS